MEVKSTLDPVGAIAVHGICGIWGTLAVGLFDVGGQGLFYGGGISLLGIQAIGVIATIAWVSVTVTAGLYIIKAFVPLRVSAEEEITGLDVILLAVGYILNFVFDEGSIIYIFLMVALMIVAAALNARKKGKGIKGITWKIVFTLVMVEIFTQGVLLGFNIVPTTAQYIIPISGMLIGNSMVLSILFLNRFTAEITSHENEIELILSLGGTPKQAIHRQLINAIKASISLPSKVKKRLGLFNYQV
ncbi:hypothetical protein LSPH24S_05578 [Lysinibacillus sphaericus]